MKKSRKEKTEQKAKLEKLFAAAGYGKTPLPRPIKSAKKSRYQIQAEAAIAQAESMLPLSDPFYRTRAVAELIAAKAYFSGGKYVCATASARDSIRYRVEAA